MCCKPSEKLHTAYASDFAGKTGGEADVISGSQRHEPLFVRVGYFQIFDKLSQYLPIYALSAGQGLELLIGISMP